MTTERKPGKISEKQLVETGALLSDIDEQVRFDTMSDRVDDLIGALNRLESRLEKLDEKFVTKLESVLEKLDGKIAGISDRVIQLQLHLVELEGRVKVLSDAHEQSWINSVTKIFENKELRIALLVGVGMVVQKAGPSLWEVLSKLLGG